MANFLDQFAYCSDININFLFLNKRAARCWLSNFKIACPVDKFLWPEINKNKNVEVTETKGKNERDGAGREGGLTIFLPFFFGVDTLCN